MNTRIAGYVVAFVVAAAAGALIERAARSRRPVAPNDEGWTTIRPGPLILGTLIGTFALSLFLGFVYFFVGSSRPDAGRQMLVCLGLAIAFLTGAVATFRIAYGRKIAWRGDALRIRPLFGAPSVRRLSDVRDVARNGAMEYYCLTFADGYRLKLSFRMPGTQQLVEQVSATIRPAPRSRHRRG